MRRPSNAVRALLPALALLAASPLVAQPPAGRSAAALREGDSLDVAVRRLADGFMRAYFARHPEEATITGLRAVGDSTFFDTSDSALAAWQAREDAWLDTLRRLDLRDRVGSAAWVTHGVLLEKLESDVAMRACHRERWRLDALEDWLAEYEQVAESQPVGTPQFRAAALARWRRFPERLRGEERLLREGLRTGWTAPREMARRRGAQLAALANQEAESSPFASPARRDPDPAFRAEFLAVVRDSVLPALAAHGEFLVREYAPRARQTLGVGTLPDGERCFEALVRRYTTLPWSAATLDSVGRAMLADAAAARRREAITRYGVRDDRQLMEQLTLDPRYTPRSTEELLRMSEEALERARAAVPRWFAHVPERLVPTVDTFPSSVGASGPTGRAFVATGPGARSRYLLNPTHLRDAGGKLLVEQLAFHEAVPGHLLQGLVQLERPRAHVVTRYFWQPAFGEGWGSYAQELAAEMGIYSEEAYRVPLLDLRVLTAASMVVSAGLHAHGWTREQAVDTLRRYLAWAPERLEYQVDLLVGAPGQATAYGAGLLEIERLRAEAERALGDRFDIRRFHDAMLADGTIPLPMLRARIAQWIAAERASTGTRPPP